MATPRKFKILNLSGHSEESKSPLRLFREHDARKNHQQHEQQKQKKEQSGFSASSGWAWVSFRFSCQFTLMGVRDNAAYESDIQGVNKRIIKATAPMRPMTIVSSVE